MSVPQDEPLSTLKYVLNSLRDTKKTIQESVDYHASEAKRYAEQVQKIQAQIEAFERDIQLLVLEWSKKNY